MKKNIRYIIISIVGVSSFTILLVFNFLILPNIQLNNNQINDDNSEKQYEVKNISVYIDYSGVKENEIFQDINLTNFKTTVYHAILNCCDIEVNDFGWGIFVERINGVGVGWIYWINNNAPPSMPCNYYYLVDNDVINWKYV